MEIGNAHSTTHSSAAPTVGLILELAPPLASLLQPGGGGPARAAAETAVAGLLADLGLPARPAIELAPYPQPDAAGRFLRLSLGQPPGRPVLHYPVELLAETRAALTGELPNPSEAEPEATRRWLEAAGEEAQARFLGLVCRGVVERQPGALCGPEIAAAYLAALPEPSGGWPEGWPWAAGGAAGAVLEGGSAAETGAGKRRAAEAAAAITAGEGRAEAPAGIDPARRLRWALIDALNLRLSLADRAAVAATLAAGIQSGLSAEDLSEELIAALRPDRVEIRLPASDLEALTRAAEPDDRSLFASLRDGLFDDLGLVFPRFTFKADESVPPGRAAFRLNGLDTLPRPLLPPGEVLVSGSAEGRDSAALEGSPSAAAEGLAAARPARHPVTGAPALRLSAAAEVPAGRAAWNAYRYLALLLAAALRAHAACFVDRRLAAAWLDALAETQPVLIQAARARLSAGQIARLLRDLAAEAISIRDLRLILETVLDVDYVVVPNLMQRVVFDERLAVEIEPHPDWIEDADSLAPFVRRAMKTSLSHRLAGLGLAQPLPAFRLDEALQQRLYDRAVRAGAGQPGGDPPPSGEWDVRGGWLDEPEHEALLAAVQTALAGAPAAVDPVVLTLAEVRPYLRELLMDEFPDLPVAAFQELLPEVRIEWLGEIR